MKHSAWKVFNETRKPETRRRRVGHGRITVNDEAIQLAAIQAGYQPGEKTGEDAFARFHKATWKYHPEAKVCPGCQVSVSRCGVVDLVYTHVVCTCRRGEADYNHLVEQLWHIDCYVPQMYAARLREVSAAHADRDAVWAGDSQETPS